VVGLGCGRRDVGSPGALWGRGRRRLSPAAAGTVASGGSVLAVGAAVARARSTGDVTATTTAPASEMTGGGGAEASLQMPQPTPARIISPPIKVRALERAAAWFVKYDLS
jgi:hypothetical protein